MTQTTLKVKDVAKGMTIRAELPEKHVPSLWTDADASIIEQVVANAAISDAKKYSRYPQFLANGRLVLKKNSPVRKAILNALKNAPKQVSGEISQNEGGVKRTKNGKIDGRTKAGRALRNASAPVVQNANVKPQMSLQEAFDRLGINITL